ncbi:MAG: hypothetical protein HC824_22115, partial [Synechococcales cyanobacterium RM1_1_8]|nr:hypothetical protein [Synechococcales cyanobacterium RM1_1_8]
MASPSSSRDWTWRSLGAGWAWLAVAAAVEIAVARAARTVAREVAAVRGAMERGAAIAQRWG